jgi:ATP-dependent protease ClpP protease subunit
MPDLAGEKVAYFGFCGPIDSVAVTKICQAVNIAVNENFDGIYLNINSPGGYMGDGIYLYNHLRALPIPVTIHNTGSVSSIATTIFVAGTTRYCTSNAIFMIHPVTVGSNGSMAATALKAALQSALHDEQRTEAILRERTHIPDAVFTQRLAEEVYLSSTQALEYGLVDEIRNFVLPAGNQLFQI